MRNRLIGILLVAAISGFLALSWELIWVRLYSFASGSRAYAFAILVGSYLFGLAGGSLLSMRWQKAEPASWVSLGNLILGANCVAVLVLPLVSWMLVVLPWPYTLPVVAVASMLQGTVLPLLCHVSIPPDDRAGARLSHIYLANIIGSGAGSLLTGFLLTDWLGVQWLSGLLVVAALSLTLWIGFSRQGPARWKAPVLSGVGAITVSLLLCGGVWERLQYKRDYQAGMRFEKVLESRHGVITVDRNHRVYGNGVYDGEIKTDLAQDWHVRPYFLSAVHPSPREVLIVGMSAGVWTQIIASHPTVERVSVVEISEAYLDLIGAYPAVASILQNPKVEVSIDDGRRWMKRNHDRRFDAIVMNTTFHWREFASSLLSREFLELAKSRLRPGGIVMWNCTGSARAIRTGMDVFPHTMMCLNNCIGSDSPLQLSKDRWRDALLAYQIDNRPAIDITHPESQSSLESILGLLDNEEDPANGSWWYVVHRELMQKLWGSAVPITDDNLGHEYEF